LLPGQSPPCALHSSTSGINAAKNYQNDGDSVYRLFYDTIKGGDYRAREETYTGWPKYRLTSSTNALPRASLLPASTAACWIIAHLACTGIAYVLCQGPNRSAAIAGRLFGLNRQIHLGKVKMYTRTEMLDVVMIDGHAKGIVTRNLINGKIETHTGHAVLYVPAAMATFFIFQLMPLAQTLQRHGGRINAAHFLPTLLYANTPYLYPVTGDHQSKLTLMSESLRNDAGFGRQKQSKLPSSCAKALLRLTR